MTPSGPSGRRHAAPADPLPTEPIALSPGDRVAITGAAGFIGSAITREVLARGATAVAVVEPAGDLQNLKSLDVDVRLADVRDAASVRAAIDGCRFVFHAAAVYGFWAKDPAIFYEVNVTGSRNVVRAAVEQHCERVVYTSTVGTLGLAGPARGIPATEADAADIDHLFGHYKRSKYVAEHEVLRATAEGAPVVLVLPTFPLGPRDRRPTPTGKVVVDYLNGRIPGYVDTAMNVVHVDDLARGHVLALEKGCIGRSYIVGGDNLAMHDLLHLLSTTTGLPEVRRRFPSALALAAGTVSEMVEGRILRRQPLVPLEAARMSGTAMIFDDSRARGELGYTSRPPESPIEDSVRWFVDHGYVTNERRRRQMRM